MTIEQAVARMQNKDGPYFGIIVENNDECMEFLNKLQAHMPQETVRNAGSLRKYAFREGQRWVIVTLSRFYPNQYNRWSCFNSIGQIEAYARRNPDQVDWVMWCDLDIADTDFVDLLQ